MSIDRCTTHHSCDCRQAMLEAAEKEVRRLEILYAVLGETHQIEIEKSDAKGAIIATLRHGANTLREALEAYRHAHAAYPTQNEAQRKAWLQAEKALAATQED